MKNLFVYLLLIILPWALLIYVMYNSSQKNFIVGLFAYLIVYRPIIDGLRLSHFKLIDRSNRWKLLLPFFRAKYFKQLYFTR